jgi:hypothetical protein
MSLVGSIHVQACNCSNIGPQPKDAFTVLHDLAPTEFAVPINPVYECDGDFANVVTERSSARNHFHLEHISLGLRHRDDVAQYGKSVESGERWGYNQPSAGTPVVHFELDAPKAPRKIGNIQAQYGLGQKVGAAADKFSLQVPTIYASGAEPDPM